MRCDSEVDLGKLYISSCSLSTLKGYGTRFAELAQTVTNSQKTESRKRTTVNWLRHCFHALNVFEAAKAKAATSSSTIPEKKT